MKAARIIHIVYFSLCGIFLLFIWGIIPYLTCVSSHPFKYYSFKQSVLDGEIIIQKRDSVPEWFEETVYMKNTKTGMRYQLSHCWEKQDFERDKRGYKYLVDVNGEYICWRDNDEIILDFLNKKK